MDEEFEGSYIAVIKYGDPNSHLALTCGFGPFKDDEDAKGWVSRAYRGASVISEIVIINEPFEMKPVLVEEEDS